MSKLTELLKQHGLTTTPDYAQTAAFNLAEAKAVYPDLKTYDNWQKTPPTSGYIECKREGCRRGSHYFEHLADKTWRYSWPGQNKLISKKLLPLEIWHEIIDAKASELEAARKKRFESIKSPRDAVRIIMRDLGIKVNMVGGNPRVDCGPFEIEFRANKEESDPVVHVLFVYRAYYVKEIAVTKLTIADPDFTKRVQAIVTNGTNLNKLILGEFQPIKVL